MRYKAYRGRIIIAYTLRTIDYSLYLYIYIYIYLYLYLYIALSGIHSIEGPSANVKQLIAIIGY